MVPGAWMRRPRRSCCGVSRRSDTSNEALGDHMPKARLKSGLTLHYQQVGQGRDLVMVHGLTGNLAVWHLQILPLLWDDFRILTYDLRGHGYSDKPPTGYSADDMAADLL